MAVGSGLVGPPPVRVSGEDGPWHGLDTALHSGAGEYVTAYGFLSDWEPGRLSEGELTRLLGSEAGRYERFGNPEARRRFAASRVLLKRVAATVLDADPGQLELARNPNGRPYIRGCGQLEMSLSHTGEVMVVGLSRRGAIGVDVEPASRSVYGRGLEDDVCTQHERDALEWLPEEDRNAAFIRLWTLKEAYSKALGHGLRLPFHSFGFTTPLTPTAVPRLLRADGSPAPDTGWQFETHPLPEGFTVSVAVEPGPAGDRPGAHASALLDGRVTSAVLGCYLKDDAKRGAEAGGGTGR
ncbi:MULTISPECIES: 4'-phosphopantetheinyl transferase family protein [unclassified Streptomyces]|uniref:4'-phosphopantetheinyl transferase family protein n=1 Tax=unclassified Streptomyces TaxID=2593676 RepID=UPI0022B6B4CC|nr:MULTISPECIES: 4'-phosphopantetheinyl transferase superfamily protein [unclassified Streptomyces]MCZ7414662.1 4'-phosphopantetheinyl transferase superfamily protein [Streptomyces sp. WMMC897]MCZ7431591.1 4'-phosphopantetheinyl transferase superfamily protein [Streptomyces sp. WMMC1477]